MNLKLQIFFNSIFILILCFIFGLIYIDYNNNLNQSTNNSLSENEFSHLNTNTASSSDTFVEIPIVSVKPLPETVILNIPNYKQQHRASCEFASLHSAMLFWGVSYTEDEIYAFIGSDPAQRYTDAQGVLHWGNPQNAFVGEIDPSIIYIDGYGIYNNPLNEFLDKHGFAGSISKTNWEPSDLYTYILQGYPAVVWISNDYETKEINYWIDSDNQQHKWIYNEHAVVLKGVDKDNVHIMDVGNGTSYSVSKEKFERGFANLDNMGIVVIKN